MIDPTDTSSGSTWLQATGKEDLAETIDLGQAMYTLCQELFPICRSITGEGVRETLAILKAGYLPDLQVFEIKSGNVCFDWTVPKEWNVRDAFVIDPNGDKVLDFKESNLHVLGYSRPVDAVIPLEELQDHLFSLPEQPDAIPYVTSYYQERWGFCLKDLQRKALRPGNYRVFIDSELTDGSLTYGELVIPGETEKEVFISTYVCHPSMANDNLSGPAVATYLARWLTSLEHRKYTYRVIFIPETIGSIVYLSRNLDILKKRVIAGFNLTCIGDDRCYSYLPSRAENTLADHIALHVLRHMHSDFERYIFLDRGSDERQYCSPGIDLPVVSVMRSKYGAYPEYHTSLDDLSLVSASGLYGGYEVLKRCIECIERNEKLKVTVNCEPQLGKRGLYPTLSKKSNYPRTRVLMNLLTYCDGENTLLEVAEKIGSPMWELFPWVDELKRQGLLLSS